MFGSVVTLYRYKFKDHPDRNALRDALISRASRKVETLGVGIINWQDKMIKQSIRMRLKSTSKGNGASTRCDLEKNSEESI
ncbi:hypothetical protein HZH68_005276 [Vespula germanica]|uniref:Uncharacterized protein n=1 Tax=Vespula germanica TaxID=30212 RepID=A0A834KFZ0_VESGE|nr:hypothetical protein HZH68_005276 [Vespula germanica]